MLIDLNVFPLSRQDGQDRNDLPGLYMVTPPRRAARGRDSDRLLIYFSLQGNDPLVEAEYSPLLQRLAQTYYKVPGSITSAMRASADQLNLTLLEGNLRSPNAGAQRVGTLVMAVMREDRLTLGHSGPAHSYVLTAQDSQDLNDPQGNRGLGLTRALTPRYFQIELHPNDLLVIVAQPPPAWTALTLPSTPSQRAALSAETLRRRLLSQAGANLSAVLVQAQVGTGKLRILRPKAPIQMATPTTASEAQAPEIQASETPVPDAVEEPPAPTEETAPSPITESSPGIPDQVSPAGSEESSSSPGDREIQPGNPPEERFPPAENLLSEELSLESTLKSDGYQPVLQQATTAETLLAPVLVEQPKQAGKGSPTVSQVPDKKRSRPAENKTATRPGRPDGSPSRLRAFLAAFVLGLAPIVRFFQRALRKIAQALYSILKRMLPDEGLFSLPASTMIFIAVAVAVIIAVTGGAIYFQRGRQVQFIAYYNQAVQSAEQAKQQSDPNELRTSWETVLDFLDRAETYQSTDQSKELRQAAQLALDQLDYIERADFQPVLAGGLGTNIQVVRMLASADDLYFLDGPTGSVQRAVRTGRGYEIDPQFECGPNPQIGNLIDIDLLPKGNEDNATVLGMDARGNLLYCIPGDKPISRFPNIPQASELGMGAFSLDSNTLYMLDLGNNAVWYYRNMEIDQPPHLYFGPDRPDDVKGMIDMLANRDDLYLLHKDGYMVKCVFGGLKESPTRCDDPASYIDPRPGRKNGPVILDARFSQMIDTPPPDPSLYLLDPINMAIYQFGLRLTFQRQIRPVHPLSSETASAFYVIDNRNVFLVAGNQVYSAVLP
jgi:hypothetical protein